MITLHMPTLAAVLFVFGQVLNTVLATAAVLGNRRLGRRINNLSAGSLCKPDHCKRRDPNSPYSSFEGKR